MRFKDLHYGASALVLPNAWDIPSALMFVEAGFTAIGTISLGVFASHGHVDGSRAVRELTQKFATRLSALQCFVSVDIEDGFADSATEVAYFVESLAVDGINIEDSTDGRLTNPDLHAAKVAKGVREGHHSSTATSYSRIQELVRRYNRATGTST